MRWDRLLWLVISVLGFLIFSVSAVAYDGYCRNLDDLENLPPGHWCEVPDTHLRQLEPDPLPPSWGGFKAVVSAWSGGAYDTKRQQLIVWGGGHADYAGNEIYAFDVNSLAWSRISEHTPISQIPDESVDYETYPDGNPSARHTYDGLEYIPTLDLFWSQGGALWKGGGLTAATWVFDLTDAAWEQKADVEYTQASISMSAYDAATGLLYHQGQHNFSEYTPATGGWVVRGTVSAGWWSDNFNAAIDPGRRLFVAIGHTSGGENQLRIWDLDTYTYRVETPGFPQGLAGISAPGLDFDSQGRKLVAWGTGTRVVVLDFSEEIAFWQEHPADAGNMVPADALVPATAGTFGRFRYMPDKNLFIVVNSVDQNVFFYRLNPGAGVPPDTLSPASPTGLSVN